MTVFFQVSHVLPQSYNVYVLSSPSFVFLIFRADAGSATVIYFILLFVLARQMERSRTPSGISRVSRWTFFTQSTIDSVSFAGHITFAIIAEGRPSLSLTAPAFLACTMFVYEAVSHTLHLPLDL